MRGLDWPRTQQSQAPCTTSSACPVVDQGGAGTGTFTVLSSGTVTVWRSLNAGNPTEISTLTISAGGSSSSPATDLAGIYPTAYLNPSGGTCTGTIQLTTYAGQNGTITLPDEIACTRPGYRLYQLTYTEDGHKRNGERWEPFYPDETVPIGTDSFTLFAQWQPLGVEIT